MTVLVAHTATPAGTAALSAAADEASRRGVPLVVVSADDPTTPPSVEELLVRDPELRATLAGDALRLEVRPSSLPDAADAVLQTAQLLDAELIVIGVRRRSPVGKLFLGSSAQRILLGADCPVLAVKA
jgi:nucleotide-binding universal stress UspA family protein